MAVKTCNSCFQAKDIERGAYCEECVPRKRSVAGKIGAQTRKKRERRRQRRKDFPAKPRKGSGFEQRKALAMRKFRERQATEQLDREHLMNLSGKVL